MPINRAPWNALIDDSGQNLDGSVWNKTAIKDVLLDPIDALTGGMVYGSWAPVDASGAGLVFTGIDAQYAKLGRVMAVFCYLQYPSNASGAPAAIGGLPFPNTGPIGGFYQNYFLTNAFYFAKNQTAFNVMDPATGANRTNAQLSGALLLFTGLYLTT